MWVDYSEKYEVSDSGDIRNKHTGRILKQFVGKDGYMRTQFSGKTRLVHRVVATLFCPSMVNCDFVNHKDGNKQNNSAKNLEWCDRKENIRHAYAHGLKKPQVGIENGRSILTLEQVSYIKEHYVPRSNLYGAKALAAKFGVAHQTVCAVAHGQNWS